jgi:hypothetical protein
MEAKLETPATDTTPLDPAFVDDWAQRFTEAWNRLDADAVAAMCVDDGLYWHDPTVPYPSRSRDDVRRFVVETGKAFPDFRLEWRAKPYLSRTEPTAFMPWRMTGTMRGTWSYSGLEATGGSIDLLGVDEITFRGELLAHCHSHFDRSEMARQLGVLPPIGSKGERVMTRIQNFRNRIKQRRA